MAYESTVIITGPTTTGKTDLAFRLAGLVDGGAGIICGDKFMMYSCCPTCTGLSDVRGNEEAAAGNGRISTHLHGYLGFSEEAPDPGRYREMADEAARLILEDGRLPVVEGCFPKYHFALAGADDGPGGGLRYGPRFGIRCDLNEGLRGKVAARVERAFRAGLVDEVRDAMRRHEGHGRCFVMDKSVVVGPVRSYLAGEAGEREAKQEIVEGVCSLARQQYGRLLEDDGIFWLDHDPERMERTVGMMLERIR
jgi:tRNA A37 N6-isopentenylltransferase MiaA